MHRSAITLKPLTGVVKNTDDLIPVAPVFRVEKAGFTGGGDDLFLYMIRAFHSFEDFRISSKKFLHKSSSKIPI